MGIQRFKTVLKYKASRDGWRAKDFHRMSDGKGPTIALYKIKNGSCIGGFTSAQWSSPSAVVDVIDPSALLFNLTLKTFFPCKSQQGGIRNMSDWGPTFGQSELGVKEPFIGEKKCWSTANGSVYKLEKDSEDKNNLTNEKSQHEKCFFTVTEIEVWEVLINE